MTSCDTFYNLMLRPDMSFSRPKLYRPTYPSRPHLYWHDVSMRPLVVPIRQGQENNSAALKRHMSSRVTSADDLERYLDTHARSHS